jgi:pimeloyl-ACP methyl ester carboxylesterase
MTALQRGFALTAAAAAVVATWLVLRARGTPHFAYWTVPLSQSDCDALGARPRWRARSLELEGGVVLRGLERRPDGTSPASPGRGRDTGAPWILFFPGNSPALLAEAQRFLDALVAEREWGAVVWAYRGFAGSGGQPSPNVLADDGWTAAEHLTRTEGVRHDRIHLVGFSLGTSVATAVSARAAAASFASITLLAPLTEIDVRPAGWWFGAHRYETLSHLAGMAGPTLVVHGGADAVLPPEGGRLIAARLGAHARYVEVTGAGHVDLLQDPRAIEVTREFIGALR